MTCSAIAINIAFMLISYLSYSQATKTFQQTISSEIKAERTYKLTFISKTVREYALTGNYLGVRSVFQSAIADPGIDILIASFVESNETVCISRNNLCYSHNFMDPSTYTNNIYYDRESKEKLANVSIYYNNHAQNTFAQKLKHYHLLALLALTLVGNLLIFIYSQAAKRFINRNISMLNSLTENLPIDNVRTIFIEKELFHTAITQIKGILHRYQQRIETNAIHASIGQIATQVAHDIRSPLSSMKSALRYFTTVQHEDPKFANYVNLLQLSSSRLTGIAEDLLERNTHEPSSTSNFSIHQVLDTLVGEYQSREECQTIQFIKEYSTQDLVVHGHSRHLQRALGNLMKNALEAMDGSGTYTITTEQIDTEAKVTLIDTGCGMSAELLTKVLQGGHSEGKVDGHGIGMKVVKEVAEEFGGSLDATSTIGQGTRFTLTLPLAIHENSLTTDTAFEIKLGSGNTVLVIDDEPSMREQWRLLLEENSFTPELYCRYEGLINSTIELQNVAGAIVDYHFDNSERDGFDVISLLHKQGIKHTTLCTAEYWKPNIQQQASEHNITLCPKPIPAVQFKRVNELDAGSKLPTVLVIDDDEGIRLAWDLECESLNLEQVTSFESMEDCLNSNIDFTNYDFAFVDKNIPKSDWSLDQTIQHLKKYGVAKVIIASGEAQDTLEQSTATLGADGVLNTKIPKDGDFFRGGRMNVK